MTDSTIVRITTLRLGSLPNVIWIMIAQRDGVVGLGETFFIAEAVESYVHEIAAPYLLGQDAAAIQKHWRALYRQWQRRGIGAEARGASAVDVALWDLFGKRTGLPLFQLLGGASRSRIPVYNTCAGPGYVRAPLVPGDGLYGEIETAGALEDYWATLNEPAELARSLLEQGITTMKVFPLDVVADETGGQMISEREIRAGLEPLRLIREAVGVQMEIALELRARWSLPAAKRIAAAAEAYAPAWIEDPIRNDNLDVLAEFARSTSIPTAAGENLGNRATFRHLLECGGAQIVLADPTWCGGVSETRRIAELAAMYGRPFTPHDCAGPVGLAIGTHMCIHLENAFAQEIVRAFLFGWYREVATGLPALVEGQLEAAPAPGHGVELRPETAERVDATVRTTSGSGRAAGPLVSLL